MGLSRLSNELHFTCAKGVAGTASQVVSVGVAAQRPMQKKIKSLVLPGSRSWRRSASDICFIYVRAPPALYHK